MQSRGREATFIGDEDRVVGQLVGGAVLVDAVAGGVGDQGADLAGAEDADDGADAGGGVAAEGTGAEAGAVFPLQKGAGDEKGEDGAGDDGEGGDEAGEFA